GLEVEAHPCLSPSHAKGSARSSPPSSLVRSSMRFSASSRYLEQRRASPTPSSKAFSESSSGRLPASSVSTICSSRASASSNLMSVISLPHVRHARAQRPFRQQDLDRVARARLRRAPHHRTRRQETRQAVAAPQHRERRERLEPPHRGAEPMPRGLGAVGGGRGEPAAELRQHRGAV